MGITVNDEITFPEQHLTHSGMYISIKGNFRITKIKSSVYPDLKYTAYFTKYYFIDKTATKAIFEEIDSIIIDYTDLNNIVQLIYDHIQDQYINVDLAQP